MHAAVQLLRAADEPPEAADGDWRSLLYGAQSDDDSEDLEGGGGGLGLSGDGVGIESLVRCALRPHSPHSLSPSINIFTVLRT
jgi:hypothetical protein